jgi:hypothetical protein
MCSKTHKHRPIREPTLPQIPLDHGADEEKGHLSEV